MAGKHLMEYSYIGSTKIRLNCKLLAVVLNSQFFMVDSYRWKVPIAVCTSVNPTEPAIETLLEEESCTLTVGGVKQGQWIKVWK